MTGLLDQVVDKLRKALGPDLVSVVLYGSAASGNHQVKFSDYNVLCALTEVTPKQLRATEPIFRWWREQGNPAPLLFSEEELRTSTDCFPIEFHDIRAHHKILYGSDVVSGMSIAGTFYRAQVEHDLRAKLLRLRQKASGILSDREMLRRLLIDSVSTFCVLFRHALTLNGTEVSSDRRDVVAASAGAFGIDPKPFAQLLDLREEKVKAKEIEPEPLLADYMKQIEKVIGAVDRMAPGGDETR